MSDDVPDDGSAAADKLPGPRDGEVPGAPPVPSAHQVARTLCAIVPFVQVTCLAIGAASVVTPLASSPATVRPPVVIAVLGTLLFYVLLARLSGPMLRGFACALVLRDRQTRAAERFDERLLRALEHVAEVLERSPSQAPAQAAAARPAGDRHAEVRAAIRGSDWARADELIRALLDANPDDPEGLRLTRERDEAKASAIQALRTKIDAARGVNDPSRALELRDALVAMLDAEALRTLDQELVRWSMGLIQKRLRSGTMRVDVAELAAMVAERFDHTVEGASLRASLPTLRRSAGLCARCGKPYTGIADACPTCLSTASFPAFGAAPGPEAEEDDPNEVSD